MSSFFLFFLSFLVVSFPVQVTATDPVAVAQQEETISIGSLTMTHEGEVSFSPSLGSGKVATPQKINLPAPAEKLFASQGAFLVSLRNGMLYVFGDPIYGGAWEGKVLDFPSVTHVEEVCEGAVPKGAILQDASGNVYWWGDPHYAQQFIYHQQQNSPMPQNFEAVETPSLGNENSDTKEIKETKEEKEGISSRGDVFEKWFQDKFTGLGPEKLKRPDFEEEVKHGSASIRYTKDHRLYVWEDSTDKKTREGHYLDLPLVERCFVGEDYLFCYLEDGRFYRWGKTLQGELLDLPHPLNPESMLQEGDTLTIQLEGNQLVRLSLVAQDMTAELEYLDLPPLEWLHSLGPIFLGKTKKQQLYVYGDPQYGGIRGGGVLDLPELHDICFHGKAVAAVNNNQQLYVFGDPQYGGDWTGKILDLPAIIRSCATESALLVETADHRLYHWGDPRYGGAFGEGEFLGEGKTIASFATSQVFVAGMDSGQIYVWGDPQYGGEFSGKYLNLPPFTSFIATQGALAAIAQDGRVYVLGDPQYGEEWKGKFLELKEVDSLVANAGAFMAHEQNGGLYVWGDPQYGGSLEPMRVSLGRVFKMISLEKGFLLLAESGKSYRWSAPQASKKRLEELQGAPLLKDIVGYQDHFLGFSKQEELYDFLDPEKKVPPFQQVLFHQHALAAITQEGSLYLWGDPKEGGIPDGVTLDISSVKEISGSHAAFGALTEDHRCYLSGDPFFGGIQGGGFIELPEGTTPKHIMGTYNSFWILAENGKVYRQLLQEGKSQWLPLLDLPGTEVVAIHGSQALPSCLEELSDGSYQVIGSFYKNQLPENFLEKFLSLLLGSSLETSTDVTEEPIIQLFLKELSFPEGVKVDSVVEDSSPFSEMLVGRYQHTGMIKIKLSNGEVENWLLTQDGEVTRLRNVTHLIDESEASFSQ